MTDLGFGLADRRSVLIVLFTLVFSNFVFGNPIPVDMTNAATAFIGLIILTGFVYFARNILRLILALIYSVLRIPFDQYSSFKKWRQELEWGRGPSGLRGIITTFYKAILNSFLVGFSEPSFFVRNWKFRYSHYDRSFGLGVLGLLDRVLLVGIAFAATMPSLTGTVQNLGLLGIGLLLLVYVVSGKFTLIVYDALHRAELEREAEHSSLVSAARNPNFPSKIYTESVPERQFP